MSQRSPNINVIEKTAGWTINGVPGRTKAYPSDLKVRKEPPQVLPYFSPARVLSKAEQWATAFYNRTEELKRIEAYNQDAHNVINFNGNSRPISVKKVEVTNAAELAAPERTPNPTFDAQPTYQPPRPPPPPPSTSDSWVQVNPVSQEVSTVSTQNLARFVDAATSTHSVATSSMGTSTEPMDVGALSQDTRRTNVMRPHRDRPYDRPRRRPTVAEIMDTVTSPPPLQGIPIPNTIIQNQVEQAVNAADDLPPSYSAVENDLLQQPPQMVNPIPRPLYEAQRVVERDDHQAVPPGYLFDGRDMPPGYTFQTNHAAPHVARPRRRTVVAPAAETRRRTARVPRYQTIISHDANTQGLPSSTVIRSPPAVQRLTVMPTVNRMANVIEPSDNTAAPEMLDLEPDTRGAKRRRGRNGAAIITQNNTPGAAASSVRKYNRVLTHDANTSGASSSTVVITPPSVARMTTMPPRVRHRNVLPAEDIGYSRIRMAEDDINPRPAKRRRP
ncbi:hypothetical protein HK104_007983 [Borealophlyctis nickersoniae]|nr:hypothetical protein HK104_007983 [Borealophlyctis nickersoniae]